MTKITFDESAKLDILEFLNKTVKDGLIVEKNTPSQKVLTFDNQEITLDEFGGVQKGSEVFIKNDLISVMKFLRR